MRQFSYALLCVVVLVLYNQLSLGQSSIEGLVVDDRQAPIKGVKVLILSSQLEALTTEEGTFDFRHLQPGSYIIKFEHSNFLSEIRTVGLREDQDVELPVVQMHSNTLENEDLSLAENLPAVTISQDEFSSDLGGQGNVSALLSASRDVFLSAVAYNFSAFRFDIRGLGSEYNTLLLNGVHVNDPESGRLYWSLWGGLNDVFRLRQTDIGMTTAQYDFGHMNGASNIDLKASSQRAQTRVSYAISNRSYRNRVMITHSSGLQDNGWAYTFSGSKRWAQEGYNPGTSYDAYAYFVGIEKKINSTHSIGLSVFGAPIKRGKAGPAVQEAIDLADNPYYNPYWGYQTQENERVKRNSRISHTHEPIGILRYDFTPSYKTTITLSAMFQKGRNGSTALNWFDKTNDPRPDYYRKLPSYIENEEVKQAMIEAWQTNTNVSQIDWDKLYDINTNSQVTLKDVYDNGVVTTKSGKFARYLLEDRRYDGTQFAINGNLVKIIGGNHELNAGMNYNYSSNHNYVLAKDLLGADFYLNVDKFALRDSAQNHEFIQNDIRQPDRIVYEGDKFGYDYKGIVHRSQAWAQYLLSFNKIDAHVGASVTNTNFYRDGLNQNGKFPESSFGKSDVSSFLDYGIKAGITYKINGRHYLYANAMLMTQAPYLRNSFLSIRTRDDVVPGITSEKIRGGEIAYRWQAPKVKFKISAYVIEYKDQFDVQSFFLDETGALEGFESNIIDQGFVNLVIKGVNKRHAGIEMAGEVEIFPGLNLRAVLALGEYKYTNRPLLSAYLDNNREPVYENETVYQKGFYVSGTPMTVGNIGLSYNSPDYWFAHVNVNYFQDTYLSFFPLRRTRYAVVGSTEGSENWNQIINQDKSEGGMTVDIFAGKSFKLKNEHMIFINVGINNILNRKDIVTGGFEQFRYRLSEDFVSDQPDPNEFPNKYFYAYGLNYFMSVTYQL